MEIVVPAAELEQRGRSLHARADYRASLEAYEALEDLRRRISARQTGEGVLLGSGAWLITARQP